MLSQLSGSEQRTNDCVSRSPPARKSGWWDVPSTPGSPAKAAREQKKDVKATRDGRPSAVDTSQDENTY
jgi:hypothetical protein